ncbi:hypothetical protein [Pengzhenrongella phosphoraccumulans]|uniref:hypothetical protein n=1 Tax=Pengzhenrongella phosphoraccumulans TaxID=3114394 RepID=UPI0038902FD2
MFGQFVLAYAWKLPALLVAGWLAVMIIRRRMTWWYLLIAPGLCEILACVTFFGGLFMGHAGSQSGGSDGLFPPGMATSLLNMATVFATTVALLILTAIVHLVRPPAHGPGVGAIER